MGRFLCLSLLLIQFLEIDAQSFNLKLKLTRSETVLSDTAELLKLVKNEVNSIDPDSTFIFEAYTTNQIDLDARIKNSWITHYNDTSIFQMDSVRVKKAFRKFWIESRVHYAIESQRSLGFEEKHFNKTSKTIIKHTPKKSSPQSLYATNVSPIKNKLHLDEFIPIFDSEGDVITDDYGMILYKKETRKLTEFDIDHITLNAVLNLQENLRLELDSIALNQSNLSVITGLDSVSKLISIHPDPRGKGKSIPFNSACSLSPEDQPKFLKTIIALGLKNILTVKTNGQKISGYALQSSLKNMSYLDYSVTLTGTMLFKKLQSTLIWTEIKIRYGHEQYSITPVYSE